MTKYKAVPTYIDGIRFASKKEAGRYCELKLLEKAGAISDLELQTKFPIILNNGKICTYKADFSYVQLLGSKRIVEDVKGFRTPVYKLKKKLVEALYKIKIIEI